MIDLAYESDDKCVEAFSLSSDDTFIKVSTYQRSFFAGFVPDSLHIVIYLPRYTPPWEIRLRASTWIPEGMVEDHRQGQGAATEDICRVL